MAKAEAALTPTHPEGNPGDGELRRGGIALGDPAQSEHGGEIVKGYVHYSLLEERREEELAFRADVEKRTCARPRRTGLLLYATALPARAEYSLAYRAET